MALNHSQMLFYGGIAVMIAAAVLGVAALAAFAIAKRRLRDRLEQEFGKRRHER